MENFELLLPTIPEDYEKIKLDGLNFCNREKYKDILRIFYIKFERNIIEGKISRVEKKNILLKLLQLQKDILNSDFINKLKKCIPEGLDKNYICTDLEYELLKKEFNI